MEQQYLNLLKEVLETGEERMDRTGTGTRSLFGRQIRGDLSKGFPLLTTKKTYFGPIAGELLWFLEGSTDERRLAEITYGSRDAKDTIWTGNANGAGKEGSPNAWLTNPYRTGENDVGRIYGAQWRAWKNITLRGGCDSLSHEGGGTTIFDAKVLVEEHDQIAKIIKTIKTNPSDRRMILSAYNVGELDRMSLPPCHMFAQFHASEKTKRLSCQVYIRSNDLFLGLPFNIASYALLVHMIAQVTGYVAGDLIITIGDAHIYNNHIDQVTEQLSREILSPPMLALNQNITDIDQFKMSDIEVLGYVSHSPIKGAMAV